MFSLKIQGNEVQGTESVEGFATVSTMSTLKLLGLGVAWLLASLTMAVVAAILLTEFLDMVGVVRSGETSYKVAINVIALVVFAGLAVVPFLLRRRFVEPTLGPSEDRDSA